MAKKKSFLIAAAIVLLLGIVLAIALLRQPRAKSLDSFRIVVSAADGERVWNAAKELQRFIREATGTEIELETDDAAEDGAGRYEILVGQTNRSESRSTTDFQTPMDYSVTVSGTKVILLGGSTFATAAAAERFVLLNEEALLPLQEGELCRYRFDLQGINPLCREPGSFVPIWRQRFSPPDWMADPYESIYALTHPTDRLAVLSHRGDFVNYPESSLEGLLSAIMAGADAVELDIRLTKDNILVLHHDESLVRNTTFGSKAGKAGLPTSEYIGDWTYDQLQQLRLTRNDGAVTDYKIPTLYEALLLAGQFGTQITLDEKADETAHPVFAAAATTTGLNEMLPIAQATDSVENLIYYYVYWKGMKEMASWKELPGQTQDYYTMVDYWDRCLAGSEELPAVFGFWTDPRYKSWKYSSTYEKEYYWSLWQAEGKHVIWSNNVVKCCEYIAKNSRPAEYPAWK